VTTLIYCSSFELDDQRGEIALSREEVWDNDVEHCAINFFKAGSFLVLFTILDFNKRLFYKSYLFKIWFFFFIQRVDGFIRVCLNC